MSLSTKLHKKQVPANPQPSHLHISGLRVCVEEGQGPLRRKSPDRADQGYFFGLDLGIELAIRVTVGDLIAARGGRKLLTRC